MEIKPCPWCGKQTELVIESDFGAGIIREAVACPSLACSAVGPYRETAEEAIEAWNSLRMEGRREV